jgi:DMSO/TMAO reductase YedYZ heme-binding membrane subunit
MKAAKHNFAQPMLFAVIVALLLALRVWWAYGRGDRPRHGVCPRKPSPPLNMVG